ncbi:hypothetical protein QBC44DRAFT_241628 [Cladorrhinum sp. PSN332]|nr:hypothetical protein QBC44DRAFT_241628 [Cladorrhinum sp. PSN332]
MTTFTLSASPDTDIWRKPPSKDIFNGTLPTHTPSSPPHTHPTIKPLSTFISATVTIPSKAYTHQYDQSGLLLTFSRPSSPSSGPSPEKWIKAGIELYNGSPRFSVVACDHWADWSVTPLVSDPSESDPEWTTLSIEKEGDGNGISLWVYQVLENGKRKEPVREICWVFGDKGGEGWEVGVSAMAARPAKGEEIGELKVEGKDLKVKWD